MIVRWDHVRIVNPRACGWSRFEIGRRHTSFRAKKANRLKLCLMAALDVEVETPSLHVYDRYMLVNVLYVLLMVILF